MERSAHDAVFAKKLIFTVTAGHTGTAHLARMLAAVPEVTALHEPYPGFNPLVRTVARDPGVARTFLLDLKFRFIAGAPGEIYAETAHGFGKGFLVPLLQTGARPCLVFLRRPPREVALSHFARAAIPARTPGGNATLFRPDDPNVLAIPGWRDLTDYQLCFWYALAVEWRQWRYSEFAQVLGLPRFDTTADELDSFARFAAMLQAFGIHYGPELRPAHARLRTRRGARRAAAAPADIDQQEERVWERIGRAEPDLRARLAHRYTPIADDKIARIRAA